MVQDASSSDQQAFVDAVDAWVKKALRPVARKFDLADEYPHEIVEQMKELGLFGATIAAEYGGLGLSASTYAKLVMAMSSVAAEAALQRAPAEPIQRLGEGRMRRVATERAGVLSAMRRASAEAPRARTVARAS